MANSDYYFLPASGAILITIDDILNIYPIFIIPILKSEIRNNKNGLGCCTSNIPLLRACTDLGSGYKYYYRRASSENH